MLPRPLVLVLTSLLLAGMAACTSRAQGQAARRAAPPAPVVTGRVVVRDVPLRLDVIGAVEPMRSVAVKSQVTGMLEKVHFAEGHDVRQGSLLFTIDRRPFVAALDQARAALARDQALRANAVTQKERYDLLVAKGVVSRQDYDKAVADVGSIDATIAADKAAIEAARLQLQYCSIRAPIDGRTGPYGVVAGNLVKANDNPVLVTINQIAPIYVTFAVPESHLWAVRRSLSSGRVPVQAAVPGDDRPPTEGQLTLLSNAVDRPTGTITLKAVFANADRRLWPGQFVNVSVLLGTLRGAVVAPALALQSGQQGQYAYVVRPDATVELRWLKVGPTVGDQVVIESGLRPGEEVVTDGQLRLVPGAHIVRHPAGAAPAPAAPAATAPHPAP